MLKGFSFNIKKLIVISAIFVGVYLASVSVTGYSSEIINDSAHQTTTHMAGSWSQGGNGGG